MKRWPVIRHLRWLYYVHRLDKLGRQWRRLGLGPFPGEADRRYLELVWKGEA